MYLYSDRSWATTNYNARSIHIILQIIMKFYTRWTSLSLLLYPVVLIFILPKYKLFHFHSYTGSFIHSYFWLHQNHIKAVLSSLPLGCFEQSGISLNLRTGATGHATLFNQWECALVFINKQIKTSPQWSKIFKTTDGGRQNQSSFRGSQAYF